MNVLLCRQNSYCCTKLTSKDTLFRSVPSTEDELSGVTLRRIDFGVLSLLTLLLLHSPAKSSHPCITLSHAYVSTGGYILPARCFQAIPRKTGSSQPWWPNRLARSTSLDCDGVNRTSWPLSQDALFRTVKYQRQSATWNVRLSVQQVSAGRVGC